MIFFQCKVCRTSLSAQENQEGQQVRCPNCMAAVTVPVMTREAVAAGVTETPPPPVSNRPAPLPKGGSNYGRRYGFNCAYCSSRLEATEGMAGQEGQCPTCGNAIVIPILDRYGRLIDPVTKQIIKQDPHPVHAYAAAGERAPAILREEDTGKQIIVCNKCKRPSPITANNCKHCGMPFTMEGTAPEAAGNASGFSVASLVLGIIGIPFGCTIVVPLLAVIFGAVAIVQSNRTPDVPTGRGQAIAGLICGLVGMAIGIAVDTH